VDQRCCTHCCPTAMWMGKKSPPSLGECNCLEKFAVLHDGGVMASTTIMFRACGQVCSRSPHRNDCNRANFPVLPRILVVDRSRLFRACKVQAWIPSMSTAYGTRSTSIAATGTAYPVKLMHERRCCLDAWPAYTTVELTRLDAKRPSVLRNRKNALRS